MTLLTHIQYYMNMDLSTEFEEEVEDEAAKIKPSNQKRRNKEKKRHEGDDDVYNRPC